MIQFRTASEPNRLYGAGVAGVVIDEASRMREDAFFAIRSTLTMTQGPMKIIGNPRGTRNWFYKLCLKAKAGAEGHSYHHLFSSDNPFILPEEIDDARRTLPERMFNELYLGIAEEGEGQVFTNIKRVCVIQSVEEPIEKHRYTIGWDVARKTDFSAISIIDYSVSPMREVLIERLSSVNYETQFARVAHLSRSYFDAQINFDGTSVGGDLIAEITARAGLPATPFTFNATNKAEIVNRLSVKLESGELLLQANGKDADIARGELEVFEIIERPRGGAPMYRAPEGAHDDTVIARCLALDAAVCPVARPQAGIFEFVANAAQSRPR